MSLLLRDSYEVVYQQLPGSYSSAARFVRLRELLKQVGWVVAPACPVGVVRPACPVGSLPAGAQQAQLQQGGWPAEGLPGSVHPLHPASQVCGPDDTPYPDESWSPAFDGVTVGQPSCPGIGSILFPVGGEPPLCHALLLLL